MKKTITAFVLTVLLVITLLFESCGIIIINGPDGNASGDTGHISDGPDESTDTLSETTARNYEKYIPPDYEKKAMSELESLPDKDFGSRTVFIASAAETGSFFDEDNGAVSSSVYRRDRAVEDKFGILILPIVDSLDAIRDNMRKAKGSKDLYTDIAVIPQNTVGEFNSAGLIGNVRMLPYFSEEFIGIDKEATNELSFGGKLYGVIGNATKTPEKTTVIFVNTTLSDELNTVTGHNEMISGGFTAEKFFEAAKLSRISVDKDELPDVYTSLFFSGGGDYTSEEKTLTKIPSSNAIVSEISKIGKFMTHSFKEGSDTLSGLEIFKKGHAIFAVTTLDRASELGSCGFMWDIFPLPKFDENQRDYISVMSYDAPVMTVSTFTDNIDAMSYAMNGINAASYGFISLEYGQYLQNGYVTSSKALDSFDLICSLEVKYDAAVMFRSITNVRSATEEALIESVNSGSAFATLSEKYKSRFNSAMRALS